MASPAQQCRPLPLELLQCTWMLMAGASCLLSRASTLQVAMTCMLQGCLCLRSIASVQWLEARGGGSHLSGHTPAMRLLVIPANPKVMGSLVVSCPELRTVLYRPGAKCLPAQSLDTQAGPPPVGQS